MNKIIKQQLEQVTATELKFDDNTVELFIPKTVKISNASLKKGKVYLIELHSNITHPSSESMLASNWNNGIIPKFDKYIVEINDNMSKMIKVTGVALDDNTSQFNGWLPYDGFDVLSSF